MMFNKKIADGIAAEVIAGTLKAIPAVMSENVINLGEVEGIPRNMWCSWPENIRQMLSRLYGFGRLDVERDTISAPSDTLLDCNFSEEELAKTLCPISREVWIQFTSSLRARLEAELHYTVYEAETDSIVAKLTNNNKEI